MNILFGVMVALAVFLHITTVTALVTRKTNPIKIAIAASICTGIAAGMAFGGGV